MRKFILVMVSLLSYCYILITHINFVPTEETHSGRSPPRVLIGYFDLSSNYSSSTLDTNLGGSIGHRDPFAFRTVYTSGTCIAVLVTVVTLLAPLSLRAKFMINCSGREFTVLLQSARNINSAVNYLDSSRTTLALILTRVPGTDIPTSFFIFYYLETFIYIVSPSPY